jgi:hypothetical protein
MVTAPVDPETVIGEVAASETTPELAIVLVVVPDTVIPVPAAILAVIVLGFVPDREIPLPADKLVATDSTPAVIEAVMPVPAVTDEIPADEMTGADGIESSTVTPEPAVMVTTPAFAITGELGSVAESTVIPVPAVTEVNLVKGALGSTSS